MMTGSWVCRWAVRVRVAAVVRFLLPERVFPPPPAFPFLLELAERDPRPEPPLRDAAVPRPEPDLPVLLALVLAFPRGVDPPDAVREPFDEERRPRRFPPAVTVVGSITSGGSSL
jgi:hypothetical protein